MDKPLVLIMMFPIMMAIIGLGIAFVGLAYHHHRRHLEMLRLRTHVGMHQHANG